MPNKIKNIFIFFFFFQLLLQVNNYQIQSISFSEFKEGIQNKIISEGITYEISYSQEQITSNYLKILLTQESSNSYIYFSPTSNERKGAVLFNSEYKKEVPLYINKDFLNTESNLFYLTVSCLSNECSFSLSIKEMNEINLSRDETYSYYTTNNKNTKNIFKINRDKDNDSYITFWATGHKSIDMSIKYHYSTDSSNEIENIPSIDYVNGKISSINESKYQKSTMGDCYYIIEINSDQDALVTFGTKTSKVSNDLKLYSYNISSKEMQGYLNQDISSECYNLNINNSSQNEKLYLNVIDFNKLINIEIKNKEDKSTSSVLTIPDGMDTFELTSEYSNKYICFSLIDSKSSNGFYTFQVISKSTQGNYLNLYFPQIQGYPYKRFLSSGESNFYSVLPQNDLGNEFKYNIKVISGYLKIYIMKCEEYPKCKLDLNNLPSNTIIPQNINDIYSYSLYSKDISKMVSGDQYVLFAHCQNSDANQCIFETNFFTEKATIYLKENERFYNKISENEKDSYTIKLNNFNLNNSNKFIIVNFIAFNGDISINFSPKNGYNINSYLSGNKNFFIIKKESQEQNINDNELTFVVSGISTSYYTTYFNYINIDSKKEISYSESGVSYIETILPETEYKYIKIKNRKKLEKSNFITNFLSLNCQISIKRVFNNKETSIENINNFAQDILVRNEENREEYDTGEYQYCIKLEKMLSVTEYQENNCMIYISSIEQNNNNENDYKKKQILVSEGSVNQIKMSKNLNQIEYIYPHLNKLGYVILFFNTEIDTKININIEINNKHLSEIKMSKSKYYIMQESIIRSDNYCPINNNIPNQPCNIKIKLSLDEKFYSDEPIIKFNVKSKEVYPIYLSKLFLRQDIAISNYYQYYYIEIGKKEEGEVIINFNRGNGKVFSRIIPKNENEEYGWMNKYILPDEESNELTYDLYIKTISYTSQMTSVCNNGCYLIIKVEATISEDNINLKDDNIVFPFSIIAHSNEPSSKELTEDQINFINVPSNEYVFGNTNDQMIKKYYTFFVPNDCDEIIFELQTEVCKLHINIGDKKATINSDFNFYKLGVDSVYRITKEKINEILKRENNSSIKNIKLNIAVSTEYLEDFYTSLYSFRIRTKKKDEIEVIHLNSDQKTICDIKGKNGNCYFLLATNKIIHNLNNNLFFYALEENEVKYKYYADIIDKKIIDENNQNELKLKIPSKDNKKWSNESSKKNYLYINNKDILNYFGSNDELYILLNVELNSNKTENDITTVNLIHTLYTYMGLISPNPTSMQLFSTIESPIRFRFPQNEIKAQNTRFHIINLSGSGYIINERNPNEKFYLSNPEESIDISIDINLLEETTILKAINSNNNEIFGFYLYYEVESPEENFNELEFGRPTEIIYKNTDFPFILISKLPDKKNIIDVEIKLNIKDEAQIEIIKENEQFDISGVLTGEEIIYSKKSNYHKNPSFDKKINGIFNSVSNIGRIQFTPSQMEDFKIENVSYLFIMISKSNKNKKIYNDISLDCVFLPSNKNGYYASINKYIEGKLPYNYEGYIRYELNRLESKNKYMRIEFSTNTDKISYAINYNKNINENLDFYKNNTNFDSSEFKDGKSVIILNFDNDDILSVYLTIFNKDNQQHKNNDKISNFIFKYEVGINKDNFSKKYLKENNIKFEFIKSANKIVLNIPQIITGENKNFKIDYYTKLISADEVIQNEKLDTISNIESKSIKIYRKSVTSTGEEQQIELTEINEDRIYYIVIIAKVNDEKTSELFSFKNIYNPTNQIDNNNNKPNSKGNNSKIIVIIIISIIIIILIIVFYLIYYKMKKSNEVLLKKINSLSFISPQEEGMIQ